MVLAVRIWLCRQMEHITWQYVAAVNVAYTLPAHTNNLHWWSFLRHCILLSREEQTLLARTLKATRQMVQAAMTRVRKRKRKDSFVVSQYQANVWTCAAIECPHENIQSDSISDGKICFLVKWKVKGTIDCRQWSRERQWPHEKTCLTSI